MTARTPPPPDPPPAGMREKKKARTRETIVNVALDLFERKGFDETTVEEIAAAADISPRTLFRYFTSKEDVLFLGQDAENALVSDMVRTRAPDEPLLDALLRGTRLVLENARDTFKHAQRSLAIIERTPALRGRRRQTLVDVQDIIVAGLTPKRATKAEALRMRVLIAMYMAAVNEVMNAWIAGGAKGDPTAQLSVVEELFRAGLR